MISDVMITNVMTIRTIGPGSTIVMGANNKKSNVSYVRKWATRSRLVHIAHDY